jgi:ABC-type branched-subunit amino acid transport system substrate-binding protein
MTQQRFDDVFNKLPTIRKNVLKLFLEGYDDSEIALIFPESKNPEGNVRVHISLTCGKFDEINDENRYLLSRDRLIKLFYKFKRSWLIPPLFDEWTNINSNFYLQPGIEYFDRQEYTKAIEMFQKARNADPKDPIVQIYLNNARACLYGKTLKIAVVVAYQNDFYRDAADNVLRGVADAQAKFNNAQSKLDRSEALAQPLLEVTIANDRNDPRTAKRVAEILCLDPEILGVIGHHSSEGSQAALKIYEGYKEEYPLAIISPTSTSSKLESNVFFRTVGSTKTVADTYADYIINDLKCNKIVICYHSKNAYSQTLKEDCELVFSKRGINIIELISIDDPHLDLERLIQNISRNGQSKVLLVLSSIVTNPVALALARENLRLGASKLQLLFSTAMSESLTFYKGANAIENVALISPNIPEDSVYKKQAKSRWGQSKLDWRVATSHDAAQALLEAIELSEQPTRMEILQNLNGLKLDDVDRTSGCGLEFSMLDNSNILVKYRIDRISIE